MEPQTFTTNLSLDEIEQRLAGQENFDLKEKTEGELKATVGSAFKYRFLGVYVTQAPPRSSSQSGATRARCLPPARRTGSSRTASPSSGPRSAASATPREHAMRRGQGYRLTVISAYPKDFLACRTPNFAT